jgi:hypothetical protein
MAFRAKPTVLRGEKDTVFYFAEGFRLQQYDMFGRAPSSRCSRNVEWMCSVTLA